MAALSFTRSLNARSYAALLLTLFLASCGGGGGGGGTPSDSGANGNSSSTQFPDTPPPSLSDVSTANLVAMDRYSSRAMADVLLYFTELSDSLFTDTRGTNWASPSNDNQIATETTTCKSGSVTSTYRVASNGTGRSIDHYSNCNDGTLIKDGYAIYDISRTDTTGIPLDFVVSLSQYNVTQISDRSSFSYNGTLAATTNNSIVTTTLNIEIANRNTANTIQADNLVATFDPSSLSHSYYPGSRSGSIYERGYGKTSIDPTSTIQQIKLVGFNNTSVKIDTSFGTTNLALELDSTGDGVSDAYAEGISQDNLVQTNITNAAPDLTKINDTYTGPYPAQFSLSANVTDPDYDYLSYQWAVTSAPSGAPYTLNETDYRDVTFNTSYPGDYTVRLTITDNGGPTIRDIHIHVQKAAPVILTSTTVSTNSSSTLNLQLNPASSIDGPYTYTVISGPAGLTVDSQGLLSFTPGPNPLLPETVYDTVIRVNNTDSSADVKIPITVYDATKNTPIVRTDPRFHATIEGVGNFDGSGSKQILLMLPDGDLSALKWSGTDYIENWVQPFSFNSGQGIPHIAIGDIDNDQQTEIVEATNTDNHVHVAVFKGDMLVNQRAIALADTVLSSLGAEVYVAIADIDNDGNSEIVLLTNESYLSSSDRRELIVLDANTLATKWTIDNLPSDYTTVYSRKGFTIANVNNDPALEIVTATGFVIDGSTHAIEIQHGAFSADTLCAADFDGTGIKKIVSRDANGNVNVYDAIQKNFIKTFNSSSFSVSLMSCADVDNDGKEEIAFSSLANGTNNSLLSLYNLNSTEPFRQISTPAVYFGDGSMIFNDINSDGIPEFIASAYSASGNYLSISSLTDGSVLWSSAARPHFSSFSGAFDYQLNSSDHAALFWGASDSTSKTMSAKVDLSTQTVVTNNIDGALNSGNNYADVKVADYDNDGHSDLFLLSNTGYGYFRFDIVNQEDGVIKRSYTPSSPIMNPEFVLGDLTGDNDADVLFGDSPLYVYDAYANTLSNNINSSFQRAAIGDLDGDGTNELVTAVNNQLSIYKKIGGAYQLTTTYSYSNESVLPKAILISDINNDGTPEIVLTTSNTVYLFNNQGIHIASTAINGGILAAAADRFAPGNLLLAVQSQPSDLMKTAENTPISYLLSMNPFTGQSNWRSGALWGTPSNGSMHYGPDVSPNHPRLFLGTSTAMYIIQ